MANFNAELNGYVLQINGHSGEGILMTFVSLNDKDAAVVARAWLKRNAYVTKEQVELVKVVEPKINIKLK